MVEKFILIFCTDDILWRIKNKIIYLNYFISLIFYVFFLVNEHYEMKNNSLDGIFSTHISDLK